ncbi:hypothetical protein BKP35_13415 [Anaerobacillus arseniciselenatis]|uniref:Uncharacterized protein n=1 Tax=Anaerobacillus arseniciselenatis TaxID=85682 RepID=A0A1S2LCX6_9BACI|nr:hypothetical protein [Anaerobacillus arseniciselenatis]OIJ10110.1 hypothetical protein BKP35_13415 [Anaerobacillus arseniciselenatis]
MNNHFSESNYANVLLQLQQSLNSYLESIQQLIEAIEKSTLKEQNKNSVRKSISATITTLLEVQKIIYKKIQILISNFDLGDVFDEQTFIHPSFNQIKKKSNVIEVNKEINNMEKYHFKKENQSQNFVYYRSGQPAPPWKAVHLNNN